MACGCKEIVHGAVGIAKAVLGIDKPDWDTIGKRRYLCHRCEHRSGSVCQKCGCIVWAKTTIMGEKCPVGKW